MSTHAVRALIAGLLCCLLHPAAANAQIGKGWLERLSGPGPFRGLAVIDVKWLCLATVPAEGETIRTTHEDPVNRTVSRFAPQLNSRTWATLVGCHFLADRDRPRMELGVTLSPLSSGANPLNYSHLSPAPADTGINLRMVVFTADLRVNRVLDVGAGFGWARFSPEDDLFPSFTRYVGQPLRLTTRPLSVLIADRRKSDWLLIQFDGLRFQGGFTAEDFGAFPGSFDEPGEMLWSWGVKIDLTPVLWR